MKDRVPDLLVERLALGELDAKHAAEVKARLEEEPEGLARLEEIQASNEVILKELPPEQLVPAIQRRLERAEEERRVLALRRVTLVAAPALVGAVAAVVLILVVLPERLPVPRGATPESTARRNGDMGPIRLKGGPLLTLYRKGDRGVEQLRHGDEVQAGDRLQIGYTAARARHGVILSVDGRGAVSLHFPRSARASTRLKEDGPQVLPYAYQLDDAPAYERFFFVTSHRPIHVKAVQAAAREVGKSPKKRPRLPRGLTLAKDVILRKRAARQNVP